MRLFESSALYRGSDKHRSYVERSVYKALAGYSGKFYRPRDVKKARKQAEDSLRPKPDPLASYLGLLLDPSQWTGRKAASAYKTFCGMVVLAAEHGIVDDDENLRIGSDVRRLAEAAGIDGGTMSRSALPYLSERGLIRWKQGKGNKAGVFVLKKPSCQTNNTKGTTHFSVVSSVNAETALKTLRLLIRMRQGSAKGAALLRLGMASMFVAISLVNSQARGQSLDELALSTGRRKDRLREAIGRLKVAGIVRVTPDGTYRLAENFAVHYERALELSGVTYSERAQRRRHADDRARRNAKIETDKQANALAGKDQMGRVMERRREAEKGRWIEEERRKAGMTAAVFLAEEMADVVSVRFVDVRERWVKKGGKASDLLRAARYGPYRRKRSRDGYLYIDHHPARKRDSYDKKVADTARRMRERASGG